MQYNLPKKFKPNDTMREAMKLKNGAKARIPEFRTLVSFMKNGIYTKFNTWNIRLEVYINARRNKFGEQHIELNFFQVLKF